MCVSTVLAAMPSEEAISSFDRPSMTSRTTSRSRAESATRPDGRTDNERRLSVPI